MRILMTTDAVGGVWQYSLALVRGLVRLHGCRVMLVCFGRPREEDVREWLPNGEVELHSLDLKLEWMPDSHADVERSLLVVERLAQLWGADLIHANQYCMGMLDSPAPIVLAAHSDVLGWLAWHRGVPRGSLSGITMDDALVGYRQLVKQGLRGTSAVVSPSRFAAETLLGIYAQPSVVIHNGLWPDRYDPAAPKENAAVIAGRLWDEAKGAAVAIRAAEGLPLELRLVGPTAGPSGEAAGLPTPSNARLLGCLTWRETRAQLARAKIYLAPSSYEPFGLAALEAALCGCALLLGDIPSFREIWGDAAVYCPIDQPGVWRSRMAELLDSPEEVRRLGEAARSRALARYCAPRMVADYWGLYRSLGGRTGADSQQLRTMARFEPHGR